MSKEVCQYKHGELCFAQKGAPRCYYDLDKRCKKYEPDVVDVCDIHVICRVFGEMTEDMIRTQIESSLGDKAKCLYVRCICMKMPIEDN